MIFCGSPDHTTLNGSKFCQEIGVLHKTKPAVTRALMYRLLARYVPIIQISKPIYFIGICIRKQLAQTAFFYRLWNELYLVKRRPALKCSFSARVGFPGSVATNSLLQPVSKYIIFHNPCLKGHDDRKPDSIRLETSPISENNRILLMSS